jgi:hypothetical protein
MGGKSQHSASVVSSSSTMPKVKLNALALAKIGYKPRRDGNAVCSRTRLPIVSSHLKVPEAFHSNIFVLRWLCISPHEAMKSKQSVSTQKRRIALDCGVKKWFP